jgi:hypothetical protein
VLQSANVRRQTISGLPAARLSYECNALVRLGEPACLHQCARLRDGATMRADIGIGFRIEESGSGVERANFGFVRYLVVHVHASFHWYAVAKQVTLPKLGRAVDANAPVAGR